MYATFIIGIKKIIHIPIIWKKPLINKKLKNKFVLYSIIYKRIKERINLHMYTHNCLNTFFCLNWKYNTYIYFLYNNNLLLFHIKVQLSNINVIMIL